MEYFQFDSCELWLQEVTLEEYAVRGALIRSQETAVIWDTLSGPADMAGFLPLLGDRRLIIVYSHADYDHIWGTGGLPHETAEIFAEKSALSRFTDDVPRTLAEKQQQKPGQWDDVILVPPTRTFVSEMTLGLDSEDLVLQAVPGHTTDTIVGFLPSSGILLAGDVVESPVVEVTRPEHVVLWLGLLRQWFREPQLRRVIPAHGPVGGKEVIGETIAYLESLLAGRDIYPAGTLSGFYRDVHQHNLALMAAAIEDRSGKRK